MRHRHSMKLGLKAETELETRNGNKEIDRNIGGLNLKVGL